MESLHIIRLGFFFCWRPWAAFSIPFTISSYVSIMIIVMLIKAGFCSQLECSSVVVLLAEGTLKIFLVISSGEAGCTGVVSCWVKVSVYFLKGQLNIFLDSIDLQCNLRSQYLQASFLYLPAKGTWARELRISKTHKKVGLKHWKFITDMILASYHKGIQEARPWTAMLIQQFSNAVKFCKNA